MNQDPQYMNNSEYPVRKSSGNSFGATGSSTPKGYFGIKDNPTEESLETNLTNDSVSTSSATQFSNTAFTSLTSLGEPPIDTGSDWQNDETDFQRMERLDIFPQNDYLSFIYPDPVLPPSYDDLPPGGCPKYPIIDGIYGNEQLPGYAPAAFKFGICQKKQEWISPYDISSNRSWKTVVMELNSTQLNLYVVSSQLEKTLWNRSTQYMYEPSTTSHNVDSGRFFSSIVTSNNDLDLFTICEGNGLFELEPSENQGYRGKDRRTEYMNTSQKSSSKSAKLSKHKLIRSYSLQHAKFGLANDYTKKPNVLRLRLENEQFLIHFSSTQDLIDWHLALSVGKDVSLDISEREVPKYRTVPRRRRNTIGSSMFLLNEAVTRRSRSHSDPCTGSTKSRLRSSLSGFLNRRSSQVPITSKKRSFSSNHLNISTLPSHTNQKNVNSSSSIDQVNFSSTEVNITFQNIDVGNGSNSADDTHGVPIDFPFNAVSHTEEPGEFQGISNEPNHSEEEYEEELEEESDIEEVDTENIQHHSSKSSETKINDAKWEPAHKVESRRRFIRNCLKCIRPFAFDDKWLNKSMVKPITITPLISHYNSCNNAQIASLNSIYSFKSISIDSTGFKTTPISKQTQASRINGLAKSEISLNRVPCHNLEEYVVGSHYLIPKTL